MSLPLARLSALRHVVQRTFSVHLSELSQKYLQSRPLRYTHQLEFEIDQKAVPIYQLVDKDGQFWHASLAIFGLGRLTQNTRVCAETAVKMLKFMLKVNCIDGILLSAQRQGRISFYHTCYGEEGVMAGAVAGLAGDDVIFAQYREFPVVLYRDIPTQKLMDQMVNNIEDPCKGRQFPCNFGIKAVNFLTISAPLSTQMPQAVGAVFRLMKSGRTALCFFGDGGSSEGDAHAAFNFAATLRVPVVFLCRNNGYAISTPTSEQYAGDGIAGRAAGYGMACARVDGNDAIAVQQTVSLAREFALRERRPVLVEAMTYRIGDHSTSDDSRRYRDKREVDMWSVDDPILRLQKYLMLQQLTSTDDVSTMRAQFAHEAKELLENAEAKPKNDPATVIFDDVYATRPIRLEEQKNEFQKMQQ